MIDRKQLPKSNSFVGISCILYKLFFLSIIALSLLFFPLTNFRVNAQLSTPGWTIPINLSHSGSTTNPAGVVDSNGILHVIWVDAYNGTLYSLLDNGKWSSPSPAKYPFGNNYPKLISGPSDQIFAFWIDEQGSLYYSYVRSAYFGDNTKWSDSRLLFNHVGKFDLTVDNQGQMNLAYVCNSETSDSPAGVYFQYYSQNNKWSSPELIYQSPYLRGLPSLQANITIANSKVGNSTRIIVAWDNELLKQVLLSKSNDNGNTWDKPTEIAKPSSSNAFINPFHIRIAAYSGNFLVIWQDGDLANNCVQYYMLSNDGGNSWGNYKKMLENINGCSTDNQFIYINDNFFVLKSTFQGLDYLVAYNGKDWSEPKVQDALNNFNDPETNNVVNLNFQQWIVLGKPEQLIVIGYDERTSQSGVTGSTATTEHIATGTGDIWLLERPLGTLTDWYPTLPVWSSPIPVASSETGFTSPIVIADSSTLIHTFWVQRSNNLNSTSNDNNGLINTIIYTRWNGNQWLRPLPILSSPATGVRQLSVTLDNQGHFLAVWSGSKSGDIYFSRSSIAQASSADDWTIAQKIPIKFPLVDSPEIIVDSNTIYLVFAVPLNEGRGIYLTQSTDDGKNWIQPVCVFNAVTAEWEMVGNPHIALTSSGNILILWTRESIYSEGNTYGLFYAYSENKGKSWSNITEITKNQVAWSSLIGFESDNVHRLWLEDNNGQGSIWHQISADSGLTWSPSINISNSLNNLEPTTLLMDNTGQLHLIELNKVSQGKYALQYWLWQKGNWSEQEGFEINDSSIQKANLLAGAITPDGELSVLYDVTESSQKVGGFQDTLYFTARKILLGSPIKPHVVETVKPTLTLSPTSTLTFTPGPIIAATSSKATPTQIANVNAYLSPIKNISRITIVAGIVFAGLIAVVVIGIIIRRNFK